MNQTSCATSTHQRYDGLKNCFHSFRQTKLAALAVGCLLLFSASAKCADGNPLETSRLPKGLHLFGGLDLGLGLLSTSVAGEAGKSGYSTDLKILGSYYFPQWVAEFGGAVFRNRMSGMRTNGTEILIQHNSFFLELGARYLLQPSWELGGFVNLNLGEDLSFREAVLPVRAESDKSAIVTFGLQGLYRFSLWESWLARAGLRLTTDFNVPDRQFYAIQGVIHLGLPIGNEPVESTPRPQPQKPVASRTPIRKQVNFPRIQFDVGSSALEARSRRFLVAVGSFLSKNSGSWASLDVEGHSDNRGDSDTNLALSKKRADSVRQALVSGGAAADKINAMGYGESRPLSRENKPEAWLANRRVEFHFSADSDANLIATEVERLRTLHGM